MSTSSAVDLTETTSGQPLSEALVRQQEAVPKRPPSDVAKLAGGGLVGLIGKIGGQGLGVLGNIIVARMLGPSDYGLYAIGWTIMRMVGLIAPLGLDQGVVYFGTQYQQKEPARFVSAIRQSIGMAFFAGALLGGGLFVLSPWIGYNVFRKAEIISVLRWFALIFVVYAGLRVVAAATTVSQRVKFSIFPQDILQPAVFVVLVLVLCGIGLGVIGAMGAMLGSFVVALIVAIFFLYHLFPEVFLFCRGAPFLGGKLLTFSVPSAFAGIFGMYMLWVNRLLVGSLLSLEETGIYQAASQMALLFPMIQAAFVPIFLPMTTDLYRRGELGRLDELYKVSTKWAVYVSIPFLVVVLILSREVMTVLFGSRYGQGWLPLVIMVLAQAVNIGTGPVGPLLVMTGYQKRWSVISGGAFLLNIVLSRVLIPMIGISGAAIGLTVAYGAMFVIGAREIRKQIGVWPYDRRYFKGGIAALVAAGSVLALYQVVLRSLAPSLFVLAAGGIVSVGVFVGYLFWQGFDEEDREFLRLLRDRWKRLREGNGR